MRTDSSKNKLVLTNFLHVTSPLDTSNKQQEMLVQVTTQLVSASAGHRPRSRSGAMLPYQRQMQRAIGHIYNQTHIKLHTAPSDGKESSETGSAQYTVPQRRFIPNRIMLRYRRSTTANNPFTNETFSRKDNGRLSSSDTRTSSSPDDGLHAYEQTSSRQGRSNGLRHSNHQRSLLPLDKSSNSADLADDSLTSVKLTGRNRKHTPRIHKQPSLRPIHSNSEPQRGQGNATHITNTNPLSISGVNKPEITTANCDQDNGASEDRLGAGWTHAQNNARIPTVTKPPVLTSHPSPSEKAASSSGQTNLRKHYRTNSNNNNNNSTSPSANSKVISNTPSKTSSRTKDDPMYSDPIAGAPVSFQARLSELAALESETIRYERLRKVKRKTKERDD